MNHSLHNWQDITLMLRAKYKGLTAIGREVGSDWAHMNRLARGEIYEPKHSVGVKLLKLYEKHCKNVSTQRQDMLPNEQKETV